MGPEIIPELEKSLARSGLGPDQIIMISFNWETTAAAKQTFPDHRVYALSSFKKNKETQVWGPTVEELIVRAKEVGADGLNVKAVEIVDAAFIAEVKDAGLEAYVWTVDDPVVAMNLKRAGIDGITTNRPQWLAEELKK